MRFITITVLTLALLLLPAHVGLPVFSGGGLRIMPDQAEAARFGGGRSFGFRGSRGLFGGARSFRPRSYATPRSRLGSGYGFGRRSYRQFGYGGFGRGLFYGLGGFLLGGFLGRMLFGGYGYGYGGGMGLFELLLMFGGIFLLFRFLGRRMGSGGEPYYSTSRRSGYSESDPYGVGGYDDNQRGAPGRVYRGPDIASAGSSAPPRASAGTERQDPHVDAGVKAIASRDPDFSARSFLGQARENFLRFQQAWVARDLSSIRDLLDKDIYEACQRDLDALRREGRINRLDEIHMESTDLVEAWQEESFDFVTVRCRASLLDYVVCERSGEVLEGSRTAPVHFTEYWTWARPTGPNQWFLSAIEQG